MWESKPGSYVFMVFQKKWRQLGSVCGTVHRSVFLQKHFLQIAYHWRYFGDCLYCCKRVKQGPNTLLCKLSRFNIAFIFQFLFHETQEFLQLNIPYHLNELLTSVHSLQNLMAAALRKLPFAYLFYHGPECLLKVPEMCLALVLP